MKYSDYVNIKQGTASTHRFSNGNTLPLIQLPFGMAAFAPQTSDGNLRWYYHPKDRSLEGIRLTHQPSPWIADYGAMCFMLQDYIPCAGGEERWSGFRPQDTVLKPYYLKYNLLRSSSVLEFTPTERCAKIRFTFKKDNNNFFTVHSVKGDYSFRFDREENILYCSTDSHSGEEDKNFREYVVIKFPDGCVDVNRIFTRRMSESADVKSGEIIGSDVAIYIGIKAPSAEMTLGTSYISYELARQAAESEIGTMSFDETMRCGERIWEEHLSRIKIETSDEKLMRTFYSCMYRAFLYPHKCSETDARGNIVHYSPYDGKIHRGVRYTDNGFWDTYRTVYPLFSLIAREEMKQMLKSFIGDYREGGWLPRWLSIGERGCMPSTLIDAVICDGAVKGMIDKDDLETALEGMIKHSKVNPPKSHFGRNGAEAYCALGYVPYDIGVNETVNLTLDAAYGDWCIAEICALTGKKELEKEYRERALNYKNLFDSESGFMRARDKNGEFRPGFIPNGWGRDYTEGSAWQNSFAVPHDMQGLAELYGGKDKLIAKIDELFAAKPDYTIIGYDCEIHEITEMAAADFGQCAISNQPSFHIPYIYSELGETDKSAYWVKKLCEEAFSYEDDGFPGDEDNGTTAAWYIFGVLGFYPFCPGRRDFVKGAKQVDKAFILGKEFDAGRYTDKIPYEDLI